VQIIGRAELGSLVLLDEPESHLHPSLLTALVRCLNEILEALDSYSVVATHSPVVLQEIPRSCVRVIGRAGNRTRVAWPESETFGENVGYLTSNVFHLDSRQTDYHRILERLASTMSVEAIDALFDLGLSMQARAYVLALKRGALT
jgi:predicted ATP-dependent endonuclease of OLD family